MSKRLQVVVQDGELERYQEVARVKGLTLSEWVRQTLDAAERKVFTGDVERKLAALERAARHRFPAPDIEQMNAEIKAGYGQELPGL
jgi:hypothetical protein